MTELSPADRIALQDIMLSYAAAVDERERERYASCFASDVEVYNFSDKTFYNSESWVNYVWQALAQYRVTQHLLGPQFATLAEIQSGPPCALTRSDVQAMHVFEETGERLTLWATYHTQMTLHDGQWLISRHELQVRDMLRSPG